MPGKARIFAECLRAAALVAIGKPELIEKDEQKLARHIAQIAKDLYRESTGTDWSMSN